MEKHLYPTNLKIKTLEYSYQQQDNNPQILEKKMSIPYLKPISQQNAQNNRYTLKEKINLQKSLNYQVQNNLKELKQAQQSLDNRMQEQQQNTSKTQGFSSIFRVVNSQNPLQSKQPQYSLLNNNFFNTQTKNTGNCFTTNNQSQKMMVDLNRQIKSQTREKLNKEQNNLFQVGSKSQCFSPIMNKNLNSKSVLFKKNDFKTKQNVEMIVQEQTKLEQAKQRLSFNQSAIFRVSKQQPSKPAPIQILGNNMLEGMENSFEEQQEQIDIKGENEVQVQLLQSVFKDRPMTIFFPYPEITQRIRNQERCIAVNDSDAKIYDLKYSVFSEKPYNCVVNSFKAAGFKQTVGNDWNGVWGFSEQLDIKKIASYQKYNHFPGCWNLGRKDLMFIKIQTLRRKYPDDFDFFPKTYLLSSQEDRFQNILDASEDKLFILKPVNACCGKGVKIINSQSKLPSKEQRKHYLVQEYISNPHLINELKYDLRIYIVVTSFNPLRIYIYDEGLVRFATSNNYKQYYK